MKFWTFTVTYDPSLWAEQMFSKTLWLMMTYHQTKFGWKKISSFEDITETIIFQLNEPCLWSWPWREQHMFFCMIIWLMVVHHHTKHGYNTVLWFRKYCLAKHQLEYCTSLWPWPWTEQTILVLDTLGHDESTIKLSSVSKESLVQKIQQI